MSKITKKQMALFKKIMDHQHELILAYHSAKREDFEKAIDELREILKENDNDQK